MPCLVGIKQKMLRIGLSLSLVRETNQSSTFFLKACYVLAEIFFAQKLCQIVHYCVFFYSFNTSQLTILKYIVSVSVHQPAN